MKRYRVLKVIGDGTYGSVVRAQNIETGEIVRIFCNKGATALS